LNDILLIPLLIPEAPLARGSIARPPAFSDYRSKSVRSDWSRRAADR
jgi:hypothetical protein